MPGETPEIAQHMMAKINALGDGGHPLPDSTKAFFEPRFGHDFSHIQHTDAKAAELAHAVNARFFTQGGILFLDLESISLMQAKAASYLRMN